MSDQVMHAVYLPFTEAELRQHFAPVGTKTGAHDRHLKYFRESLEKLEKFENAPKASREHAPAAVAAARQLEKDERFWVVAALMGVFHPEDGRVDRLAQLLAVALGERPPVGDFATWQECLAGGLQLYFEANLPSPTEYREWLGDHISGRALIPHLIEAAAASGRFEGQTRVDAVLVSEGTGFAVLFEAKVLSDADSGWLMDRYTGDPTSLARDLPHRDEAALESVSERLGWLTFEDCERIAPGACRWLEPDSGPRSVPPDG